MIDELSTILQKDNYVKFKLYSLEYVIEKNSIGLCIYSVLYAEKKQYYESLKKLLNEFTIYGESILDNINLITLIR